MKKILIFLMVLLIFPALLHAESSYFLACQEGKIINVYYKEKSINFTRGDLFEVPDAAQRPQNRPTINDDTQGTCWSFSGNPICPLVVYYGNQLYGRTLFGSSGVMYLHGFVDLASGCWFKSESPLPIKDKKNKFIGNILGTVSGTEEEYFDKFLDKEFVDIMCSEHPIQFSAGGKILTDIKKEKTEERLKQVERERLSRNAIRQENEAKLVREEEVFQEEQQEKARVQQEKIDKLNAELKKYGAEALVPINLLEVNPYEYEGHTIAVVVQFRKMLSKSSASFYSGYTNLEESTNVSDEIIVTGIPIGTHFESGIYSPRMMLALKGKGTIVGTNAFGARIKCPHFQWIAIISGKQPSVLETQRDISFDLNPPPLVEDPERFYRSGGK